MFSVTISITHSVQQWIEIFGKRLLETDEAVLSHQGRNFFSLYAGKGFKEASPFERSLRCCSSEKFFHWDKVCKCHYDSSQGGAGNGCSQKDNVMTGHFSRQKGIESLQISVAALNGVTTKTPGDFHFEAKWAVKYCWLATLISAEQQQYMIFPLSNQKMCV